MDLEGCLIYGGMSTAIESIEVRDFAIWKEFSNSSEKLNEGGWF
jgi:hypothetical protein